jgi:hypothetical protein
MIKEFMGEELLKNENDGGGETSGCDKEEEDNGVDPGRSSGKRQRGKSSESSHNDGSKEDGDGGGSNSGPLPPKRQRTSIEEISKDLLRESLNDAEAAWDFSIQICKQHQKEATNLAMSIKSYVMKFQEYEKAEEQMRNTFSKLASSINEVCTTSQDSNKSLIKLLRGENKSLKAKVTELERQLEDFRKNDNRYRDA